MNTSFIRLALLWMIRRLYKLVPVSGLAFAGLTLLYYWVIHIKHVKKLPSRDQLSIMNMPATSGFSSHTSLSYWIIVNSEDFTLCAELSPIFRHWHILFVSDEIMNSDLCQSLGNLDVVQYTIKSAFLYAISHGANAIYIADMSNGLDTLRRASTLPSETTSWGLIYTSDFSPPFFNTGQHYGCNRNILLNNSSQRLYNLCWINSTIFVPAVLDIHSAVDTKLFCDETAPDVTLGHGTYVSIITTGSVLLESSFWAFQAFEQTNYSTVWSYMVQWLLWKTNHTITVYWSGIHGVHVRNNSYDYAIIRLLSFLTCNGEFVGCANFIAENLVKAHLISENFLDAIHKWFAELEQFDYIFPDHISSSENYIDHTCANPVKYYSLDYSSRNLKTFRYFAPISNFKYSMNLYQNMCLSRFRDSNLAIDFSKPWKQFKNMILVIIFNEPHYEVIPYLEILYRSIFPKIIYCGPYFNFTNYHLLKDYQFSFITYAVAAVNNISGALSYECAVKVARMKYHVQGFLFVSDDLLLFPALLTKLRYDSVWYIPQVEIRVGDLKTRRECHLGMCDFFTRWKWWTEYRDATISTLNEITSLCNVSLIFCNCISELKRLNGQSLRANGGYSDIFYIPYDLMSNFSMLADVFLKHGVFLEIAIPTILHCLQRPEDVQPLHGKQIWDSSRDEPWIYFQRSHLLQKVYLHPVKWSNLTALSNKHVQFFCKAVVPYMYDAYAVLNDFEL